MPRARAAFHCGFLPSCCGLVSSLLLPPSPTSQFPLFLPGFGSPISSLPFLGLGPDLLLCQAVVPGEDCPGGGQCEC